MLLITKAGAVINPRIKLGIITRIENGDMKHVCGIIVHQTDGRTAEGTISHYKTSGKKAGAHFLIEKDGTIYQTASLYKKTSHVGLLKSRCLAESRCAPSELPKLRKAGAPAMHKSEKKKIFPIRYPSNADSIGIELVGKAYGPKDNKVFENVTAEQNESLKWLIQELTMTLKISLREVYRHPVVSRKNPTEASTAKW